MSDWFRQTNWNKEIEEHFFEKLARARKESRAQYLKIQAIELIETKNPTVLCAAEMLIQKLLNDYPENKIDRTQCFLSLVANNSKFSQNWQELSGYCIV